MNPTAGHPRDHRRTRSPGYGDARGRGPEHPLHRPAGLGGTFRTVGTLGVLGLATALIAGCAATASSGGHRAASGTNATQAVSAADLRAYVAQVEDVRLPVNQLLEGADPILNGTHDHTITPAQASQRMDALERAFAGYTVAMAAVQPQNAVLSQLNAPYAHTYLLEDSYLSALAADLADGDFENLPNTQNDQRLAIIVWRTRLELVAAKAGVQLPADIQQAGRGEIAPSPVGS